MTSKNKETIIKVVDSLEAEVERLTKLLEEDIPTPLKMNDKKIQLSDYVVYQSSYDKITLSSSQTWFQYKPYYGNWELLKSTAELDKRKEHILCIMQQYAIDMKLRFEESDNVSKHNKIIQDKIKQIMDKIGVTEHYKVYDYETTRSKTKKWIGKRSGFIEDVQRVAPTWNEYSNHEDKIRELKIKLETEYAKAKDVVVKVEREEATKKKAAEDVHKLALLRAKYTPEDAMSGKWEILHAILEKDKYLNLAHYLEANRNDWNDGYWNAERGLRGFTIDNNEDQEIYDCIYKITQYEDTDGRYFRDCEYNYGMLFGKVDAALYKDYEIVKEMMDD